MNADINQYDNLQTIHKVMERENLLNQEQLNCTIYNHELVSYKQT